MMLGTCRTSPVSLEQPVLCIPISAAMDDPVCHDVQEERPACKLLSHNSVKDMLRLLCCHDLKANLDSCCHVSQAEEPQNV